MQKLTSAQGDAVLDIIEQCRTVSAALEQRTAAACGCKAEGEGVKSKTVVALATKRYQAELNTLGELCTQAEDDLGVDDDIVQGVLKRNLPANMVNAAA